MDRTRSPRPGHCSRGRGALARVAYSFFNRFPARRDSTDSRLRNRTGTRRTKEPPIDGLRLCAESIIATFTVHSSYRSSIGGSEVRARGRRHGRLLQRTTRIRGRDRPGSVLALLGHAVRPGACRWSEPAPRESFLRPDGGRRRRRSLRELRATGRRRRAHHRLRRTRPRRRGRAARGVLGPQTRRRRQRRRVLSALFAGRLDAFRHLRFRRKAAERLGLVRRGGREFKQETQARGGRDEGRLALGASSASRRRGCARDARHARRRGRTDPRGFARHARFPRRVLRARPGPPGQESRRGPKGPRRALRAFFSIRPSRAA